MSSSNERVISFYSRLMQDVGVFNADNSDLLSVAVADAVVPVMVEGKRLCLPTAKRLRDEVSDDIVFFHPLAEHVNRGPSPVFNALKGWIHFSLTEKFKALAVELMELATTKERHKKLKSKQAQFLKDLADADATTHKALVKVVESLTLNTDRRLMTLYVKNGGLSSEDKSLRSCIVSFPLLDEATNPDTTELYGVKMPRKTKDKALILALFGHILADEERRALFSSGSVDLEAPYLHALLSSFYKMATWINTLCSLYESACPHLAEQKYNLDWVEDLEGFALFRGVIPSLAGNSGAPLDKEDTSKSSSTSRLANTVFSPPVTEVRTELDRLMADDQGDRREARDTRRDSSDSDSQSLDAFLNRKRDDRGFGRDRNRERGFGRDDRDDRDRDRGRDRGGFGSRSRRSY